MSALCNPPEPLPLISQSDYNSVLWSFNNGTTKYGCLKVKVKQGNNHNKRAFGNWLANINWSNWFRANSCEHNIVIKTGLDCFFPCKTVKLHDNDKPWVTTNFKKIIEKRQRAFGEGQGPQFPRLRIKRIEKEEAQINLSQEKDG